MTSTSFEIYEAVIASGTLDQAGNTVFTLQSGNYTAHVSKGGYEDSYFNVIVTMGRQVTIGYAIADVPDNIVPVEIKAVVKLI